MGGVAYFKNAFTPLPTSTPATLQAIIPCPVTNVCYCTLLHACLARQSDVLPASTGRAEDSAKTNTGFSLVDIYVPEARARVLGIMVDQEIRAIKAQQSRGCGRFHFIAFWRGKQRKKHGAQIMKILMHGPNLTQWLSEPPTQELGPSIPSLVQKVHF